MGLMREPYSNNLHHLKDELARLDLLTQRAIERVRRPEKKTQLSGLYISEKEIDTLLSSSTQKEEGAGSPEGDGLWHRIQQQTESVSKRVSESLKKGIRLQLPRLARIFGLSPFEMDVVLICLAPELDLKYQRLYGYLQDDITKRYTSIALILLNLRSDQAKRLK